MKWYLSLALLWSAAVQASPNCETFRAELNLRSVLLWPTEALTVRLYRSPYSMREAIVIRAYGLPILEFTNVPRSSSDIPMTFGRADDSTRPFFFQRAWDAIAKRLLKVQSQQSYVTENWNGLTFNSNWLGSCSVEGESLTELFKL